jgi:hypothetical protein
MNQPHIIYVTRNVHLLSKNIDEARNGSYYYHDEAWTYFDQKMKVYSLSNIIGGWFK